MIKLSKNDKWIIGLTASVFVLGYIYRKSLKKTLVEGLEKVTDFVSDLKNSALKEWEFWNEGKSKETNPEVMERLRKYWQEGAGVKNWSDDRMKDEAWSAAFISYLMKKSGAGADWKYSPSHSTYFIDAVKNRKENNSNPFKAYKPEEVKIEVGDVVGYPRQSGVTFDTKGAYKSHSDIVVAIKDGYADTIGGNVSNSVSLTKVPLDSKGKIDKARAKNPYFIVIKNTKK